MYSKPIFISEMNADIKYYLKSVSSIQNSFEINLTSYPTTEGTPMSDNAYRNPYTITLELSMSELNKSSNVLSSDGKTEIVTGLEILKNILFNWKENFTRLVIQTRYFQYVNMIITNISWSDENSNLGKFNPTIQFSECRVASPYFEKLGPFNSSEYESAYTGEKPNGTKNGVELSEVVGGAGAGYFVGNIAGTIIGGVAGFFLGGNVVAGAKLGGKIGKYVGAAVGSAGTSFGWW